MSIKASKAKSGEELVEKSEASTVSESRGLHQENQSVGQVGMSKVSTTKKMSVMLTYVRFVRLH